MREDGTYGAGSVVPLCGISAQEVQTEPHSNSLTCLGQRATMETNSDETAFNFSPMIKCGGSSVLCKPGASERLALVQQINVKKFQAYTVALYGEKKQQLSVTTTALNEMT